MSGLFIGWAREAAQRANSQGEAWLRVVENRKQ
jgi:hypothetical protein